MFAKIINDPRLDKPGTTGTVNALLKREGLGRIQLRGGRGYQYFTFDEYHDTLSIYVYRVSDMTNGEWLTEAMKWAATDLKYSLTDAERLAVFPQR